MDDRVRSQRRGEGMGGRMRRGSGAGLRAGGSHLKPGHGEKHHEMA